MSDALKILDAIEKEKPIVFDTLVQIAGAFFEEESYPEEGRFDEGAILSAIELGILNSDEEKLLFSDLNVKIHCLVRYLVDSRILPKSDMGEDYIDIIQEAYWRENSLSARGLVAQLISELHNKHGFNAFAIVSRGIEDGNFPWNLYGCLSEVLPNLIIEPASIENPLTRIMEAVKNDGDGGRLHPAFEKYSNTRPESGEILYEYCVSHPDSSLVAYLHNILKGLAHHDFARSHSRAFALILKESLAFRKIGIMALGIFDYGEELPDGLARTRERLQQLHDESDEEILGAVAHAYFFLSKAGHDMSAAILDLSDRDVPTVQFWISSVLQERVEDSQSESWFQKVLLGLSSADHNNKDILRNIDQALSKIRESSASLVRSFFEDWIRKHSNESNNPGLPDSFRQTFSSMSWDPLASEMVTVWFNADGQEFHKEAARIVRYFYSPKYSEPPKELALSKVVLDRMTPQDSLFVLRKILGHIVAEPYTLCSLAFSLLQRESLEPDLVRQIIAAFVEYIGYNYGRAATEFLKNKTKDGSRIEKEVAEKAMIGIEAYYEALSALPRLREFEIPLQRNRQLLMAKQKRDQKIFKNAETKSVLRQFCHNIPLKGGRSFFLQQGETFSASTPLREFRGEIEFPRGEMLDPIGQKLHRIQWKMETKEKQV